MIVAIIIGCFTFAYIVVKAKLARLALPNDLTWFGPQWSDFLSDYDATWKIAESKLTSKGYNYESIKIDSSNTMGTASETQIHICGNRDNPVLLLLPGIRCSSAMWAAHVEDLVSKTFCVVCLDYPFDLGRSTPGHAKPSVAKGAGNRSKTVTNFAHTQFFHKDDESIETIMAWLREVLEKLNVTEFSAAGGYSLGAYLIFMIALKAPTLLAPKAKVFLAAPPAIFSNFPSLTLMRIASRLVWPKITGLPASRVAERIVRHDYMREVAAGGAIMGQPLDFIDSLVKSWEKKDQIIGQAGSLPPLPFRIRQLSDSELKAVVDAFEPTYMCLEWDIYYVADIAFRRAKEAGIRTRFIEKRTHHFPLNDPKKFHELMIEALV